MSTYKTLHQQGLESDDPLLFSKQQIKEIGDYVEQNPLIKDADYARGLTANIVLPESTYTYDRNAAQNAMNNGTRVRVTYENGVPRYEISGVDRSVVDYTGTAGADRDRLSDPAWLAIYGAGGYREQGDALRAQLNNPNLTEAERATIQQQLNTLHVNEEALRYHSGGVGALGYLAGADGSQAYEYELFAYPGAADGYGTVPPGYSVKDDPSSGGYGGVYGAMYGGGGGGYSNYITEMYNAQREAALASLDAAYRKNLATINRAEAGLSDAYQGARNQTAGASEIAKRNFAQYAAANGLNSGTGGQAELARNVTLQNNLNNIDTAEGQSLADLDLQRNNAAIEYNNAIAQAEAEGNYELARALYEEKVRVENAAIAAKQQEFQNQLAMMQFNAQQDANMAAYGEMMLSLGKVPGANILAAMGISEAEAQAIAEAVQSQQSSANSVNTNMAAYGEMMLNLGIMPSADILAAMGISSTDAQAIVGAIQNQQQGAPAPTLTYNQVMDAIEKGNVSPAVITAFEYYNQFPYAEYAQYGNDFNQAALAMTIPADVRSMLMTNFPGGFITGDARWQSWVDKYGEDALRAAGFQYGGDVQRDAVTLAKRFYQYSNDPDYVYRLLKYNNFSDAEIDAAMSQIGL